MNTKEKIKIAWKGKPVGELVDPMTDMWYLEGQWQSYNTIHSKEFEKTAVKLDAKTVLKDWEKGLLVEMVFENSQTYALVISLDNNLLFIRRIVNEKTIELLIKGI